MRAGGRGTRAVAAVNPHLPAGCSVWPVAVAGGEPGCLAGSEG